MLKDFQYFFISVKTQIFEIFYFKIQCYQHKSKKSIITGKNFFRQKKYLHLVIKPTQIE